MYSRNLLENLRCFKRKESKNQRECTANAYFRNADSVDIGQAPGRRPVLEKRYRIDKSHPRGILRSDLPVGRDLPPFSVVLSRRSVRVFSWLTVLTLGSIFRHKISTRIISRRMCTAAISIPTNAPSITPIGSSRLPHCYLSSRVISMNTQLA